MKKLFVILLLLLVCIGLFADKTPIPTFELPSTANINGTTVSNRDMWDILFTFEGTPAGQPAIETDRINIYTAQSGGSDFYRYDMGGNQLETFQVAGVSSLRDMAYDDEYFYGGDLSMIIYIMDLANETLIGTISVTCSGITGVRHIAYDPELDEGNGGFWIGNWDELGAIAMDGSEIFGDVNCLMGSQLGSTYDPWTEGGPYIWLFKYTGSGPTLIQFEIATLSLTGVTHNACDIPGCATNSWPGGLATYINDDGFFVMLANIQQDPQLIGVYEICFTTNPEAPGVPTNVVVTPDAGGDLEAVIDWVCPDVNIAGNPLTELDEMRVYRGDDLIYTDTSPVIGEAGTYTDAPVPACGLYTYTVVGFNSSGEGFPVSVTTWVGEDVPAAVTDLLLEEQDGNGYLTWINPTTSLYGGAFNNPILGYHIERSDGTVFEVSGIVTEYLDDTIPDADNYNYTVIPFNSVGDGGSATSNTVWIGETFSGILIIDLDPTSTCAILQSSIQNFYEGSVIITDDINTNLLASDVDAVFVLLGIYPNNTQILIGEETPITDYMNAGGNVYLEGGDVWYFDPQYLGGYFFGPLFGINALADGSGDLTNVDGADFLSGMTWSYSGENNYIDQLGLFFPTAFIIFSNTEFDYDCGISYDEGTYKTVGTSFEITGLGGTNSLDDAIEGILDFFFEGVGFENENYIPILSTMLGKNYPNPFNPETKIKYSIKKDSNVLIEIYNIKGQLVKTLVNELKPIGKYSVIWDGRDSNDNQVSSGIYFYKLKAGKYTSAKKMILMK